MTAESVRILGPRPRRPAWRRVVLSLVVLHAPAVYGGAGADEVARLYALIDQHALPLQFAQLGTADARAGFDIAEAGFDPAWNVSAAVEHGRGELLPLQVRTESGRRRLFEEVDRSFEQVASDLQAQLDANPRTASLDCQGNSILLNGREICEAAGTRSERERLDALVEILRQDSSNPETLRALAELQSQRAANNSATFQQIIGESRQVAANARQSRIELGELPRAELRDRVEFLLGWRKGFRNGVSLAPLLAFDADDRRFEGKPRSPRFGGAGTRPAFRAGAALTVSWPLGRGGRDAVELPLRSATHELRARELEYAQARLDLRYAALRAYIQLARAVAELEQTQQRGARARLLHSNLQQLVRGEVFSTSDLASSDAERLSQAAAEPQAARGVSAAQAALLRVLGVRDLKPLPWPSADTLSEFARLPLCEGSVDDWLDEALATPGLEALRERQDNAEQLVVAAKDGLRPRLDLSLSVAWAGRDEDRVILRGLGDAFTEPWFGPSVLLTLEGEWDAQRRSARGRLSQALALRDRVELQLREQQRELRLGLRALESALMSLERESSQQKRALDAFLASERSQRERIAAAESDILELLALQSRVDAAESQLLRLDAQRALLLLELRWRRGDLLLGDDMQALQQSCAETSPGLHVQANARASRQAPNPSDSAWAGTRAAVSPHGEWQ